MPLGLTHWAQGVKLQTSQTPAELPASRCLWPSCQQLSVSKHKLQAIQGTLSAQGC